MFEFFSFLFPIFFLFVFGMIVAVFVRGIRQWHINNNSPVLTVEAGVSAKRTEVSTHSNGGDLAMTSSSTSYYLTFQVESGDRMEFAVSGREYGMIAEGDFGRLTFQGTRFLKFERL